MGVRASPVMSVLGPDEQVAGTTPSLMSAGVLSVRSTPVKRAKVRVGPKGGGQIAVQQRHVA